MDLYAKLELQWAVGYQGGQLHYIDNKTLLYGTGNILTFLKPDGMVERSLQSEGSGVGPIAVCPKANLIAYAECTLQPKIFITHYPSCKVETVLEGGAQLEYSYLSFSSDGEKLVSVSAVPDFTLTLWDCLEAAIVSETKVGTKVSQVSFNPLNWKQICTIRSDRITLWNLEQCDTMSLLSPVEIVLPEKSSHVGYHTCPTFSSSNKEYSLPKLEKKDTTSDNGPVLFNPSDMTTVLYSNTYTDYMLKGDPVKPVCHCWTPEQNIYIGCDGGQLLKLECESGVITTIANPQLTLDSETVTTSMSSVTPKSGHAVFGEGSINCIALSRKGLITAGKNGNINCFEVSSNLQLVDSCCVDQLVSCLSWSADYARLAIGTEQGSILSIDPTNLKKGVSQLSNSGRSQFVGIDVVTPGNSHFVTCRCDGVIQVWNVCDGNVISSLELNTECLTIICPVNCHMAVMGTTSGYMYVVSLTDLSKPTLAWKKLMHNGPVKALRYDNSGRIIASLSSDKQVFLYDSRPSTDFNVLGYTDIRGEAVDLSVLLTPEDVLKVSILSIADSGSLVTTLQLPGCLFNELPPELFEDATKRFSAQFIQQIEIGITDPVSSLTLVPGGNAFATLDSNFKLVKLEVPSSPDQDLIYSSCYTGHELRGGRPTPSFHEKWILTAGKDGSVLLRVVERPDKTVVGMPHHYQSGGCIDAVFTRDGQYVLTAGDCGTLTCWIMRFTELGKPKGLAAVENARRCMRSLSASCSAENKILSEMSSKMSSNHTVTCEDEEKTWLEYSKEKAHKAEDETYAELKANLRQEIEHLREKVLSMIAANDGFPDIERLERQEFILDTDEYQRIQAEDDQLVLKEREEIELGNIANMFLRDQIKAECWDSMLVKGKMLKSFQSHIQVNNYPLKKHSQAVNEELVRIKMLRKIDMVEKKIRKEATASLQQTLQTIKSEDVDDELPADDKIMDQNSKEDLGDPDSLLGSHGSQLGGSSDLLLDQFYLHSPVNKKHQLLLLEDSIYRIKETFNKEFNECFRTKENEIARIREKNVSINKIINQLKLDETLVEPSIDIDEQPDRLLTVDDSEVTVKKYVSPEEQKQLEEIEKQEELKRLAEMGDNPRDRALNMMMGGRLEANVEEDLFKDMAQPDFMSKDPSELTEEEMILIREFQKKEEAFLEERERLKKSLEAELHKLQASIVQGMEQCDERVLKLFQLKIRTEAAIYQVELNVLHLSASLLIEHEIDTKAKHLNQLLEQKKMAKVQLGALISNARKKVDEHREQYDKIVSEDKDLDRTFRRDFADCEPYVDQLYKLFRKRPRGQKLKQGPSDQRLVSDPTSDDPFALRPSSAAGGQAVGVNTWEELLTELDHISYMPENLDPSSWDRFIVYRRHKIDSEQRVKSIALKLAEMNDFFQKRQEEDDSTQQDIQKAFKDLNKLQEDKMIFDVNLEIQLLLKQGQVEIDMGLFVPNFKDSVLVHRGRIEELNTQIKVLGESKLNSMVECKDFKRGINMLDWDHKKIQMEAEDLLEKARDVQMLKVTKQLQQRLMEENVASKDQNEILTLEKTIELNEETQDKSTRNHKRTLNQVKQKIKKVHSKNLDLEQQVFELEVSVSERREVEQLAGVAASEANRGQRMYDVVSRRQLVEGAKAYDQQILDLRAELERLRMRTFPALVQVD